MAEKRSFDHSSIFHGKEKSIKSIQDVESSVDLLNSIDNTNGLHTREISAEDSSLVVANNQLEKEKSSLFNNDQLRI